MGLNGKGGRVEKKLHPVLYLRRTQAIKRSSSVSSSLTYSSFQDGRHMVMVGVGYIKQARGKGII